MNRIALLALVVLASTGCVREIEVENLPAQLTSVGPLALDLRQNVIVPYTIRDPEGDDQIVAIDICDAPGVGCGVAVEAAGTDPLDRVTTIPRDSDVLHEFHWQAWCGRWVGETVETVDLDQDFVVAVWVLSTDSERVYSEPSSLALLGATDGSCD